MPLVARLRVSDVFLFPDQTYYGRCVVALGRHQKELFELGDAERNRLMADVSDVAAAIASLTECDKINYAAYGDIATHLHFHVVPKSRSTSNWGEPFLLNPPTSIALTLEQENELIINLKRWLQCAATSGSIVTSP